MLRHTCIASMCIVAYAATSLFASKPSSREPACAEFAMYSVSKLKGTNTSFEEISRLLGPGVSGFHSFKDLQRVGSKLGYFSAGLNLTASQLESLPAPFIVQTVSTDSVTRNEREHYIVVISVSDGRMLVLDPPRKPYYLACESVDEIWTGKVMVFLDKKEDLERVLGGIHSQEASPGYILGLLLLSTSLVCAIFLIVGVPRCFYITRRVYIVVRSNLVIGVAAVLIAVGGIAFGYYSYFQNQFPELSPEGNVVSLGVIDSTSAVPSSVKIRNSGAMPLRITAIRSSCSCVVPEIPTEIPADTEVAIPLMVSANPGPGATELMFESNAPGDPKLVKLAWFGTDVTPGLSPPQITRVFHDVQAVDYPVNVIIPYGDSAEIEVNDVWVADKTEGFSWYLGKQETTTTPGVIGPHTGKLRQQTVHLSFTPSSDRMKTKVVFDLTCANKKYLLSMPIDLLFESDVHASPKSILFSAIDAQDVIGMKKTVTVRSRNTQNKGEWKVASQPKGMSVTLHHSAENEATISIEVLSDQFKDGEIVISSMNESELVRIPVLKMITN